MKLDEIFITHWHGDHCLGLPGIVDTMGFEGRKRPLVIYAPEAGRVRKALSFSYSMGRFKIVPRRVPARGNKITPLLETGRFRIISTPVVHSIPTVAYALVEKDKLCIDSGKVAALGLPEQGEFYRRLKEKGEIRIEGRHIKLEDVSVKKKGKKVVYSGDTEICGNLKPLIRDADLLIQDCTYFDEVGPDRPYKHASLPEVIEAIREEKVKLTVLTHISRKHQDTRKLKELIKKYDNVRVAEDFMTLEI